MFDAVSGLLVDSVDEVFSAGVEEPEAVEDGVSGFLPA